MDEHRGASAQKAAGEPTAEEIAVRLDMEPTGWELLQLAQDPISLETPVGEEDAHLEDFTRA